MKVLITGANGFIGKNLQQKLVEREHEVICFTRNSEIDSLKKYIKDIDFIFHLAGKTDQKMSLNSLKTIQNLLKICAIFLNLRRRKFP